MPQSRLPDWLREVAELAFCTGFLPFTLLLLADLVGLAVLWLAGAI